MGQQPPDISDFWGVSLGTPAVDCELRVLRADYGDPTFKQRKGVKDPLRPCGPSLFPLQGSDVRLPKMLTFRRSSKGCD